MGNILSQDEVDALLKGVQSGDVDTDKRAGDRSGVRPYDFQNQERIVRGRMPGFEIANERFARLFRNSISNLVMRFVDVAIHGIEVIKFGEFMKTLPVPSNINIFKMEPLKGYSLLVLEAPLVFALLEFFFGGTNAQHMKAEGRSFTPIEQRVIKKIMTLALGDLASAWAGIAAIKPEHVSSEMNPQFVTIVTPSEIVIKVEVHIEIDNFLGKMFFCLPYSLIEPVKDKLYSGIQTEKFEIDQRWVAGLKQLLLDSYVDVVVEMGHLDIAFGDLMNLKVGEVIMLNTSALDELEVKIENIPKLRGVPGKSRGNQGVKITKVY